MVRRAPGLTAVALIAGLGLFPPLFCASARETKAFGARPGDTIIIQVDYGKVRINSWEQATVQTEIERVASQQSQLGNIEVIAHKQGDKIFARAFFYDYAGESVNLERLGASVSQRRRLGCKPDGVGHGNGRLCEGSLPVGTPWRQKT